jgi:excisionase family DNA binding protein
MLGIEEALREIVRDEVRKELRHHREEMILAVRAHDRPPQKSEPDLDELLTVEQVAHILKVIPETVRSWIQSGGLRASRPGDGTRPGRKYRVRRADTDAFIGASQKALVSQEGVSAPKGEGTSAGVVGRTF